MLQQTTVETARRRFEAFVRRFPDVASLARAREESVLAAWSGLGYYARARHLRLAALEMVRRHRGTIPRDPAALERLPGFGPYTAAAVAAIAFDCAVPAAEANVTRIISRLFALEGLAGTSAHRREVISRVAALLPPVGSGDVLSAFMDLGQRLCAARLPACERCPLLDDCAAGRLGRPEAFPRRARRPAARRVGVAALFLERAGRALFVRREDGLLRRLWQFPNGGLDGGGAAGARQRLAAEARRLGCRVSGKRLAAVRHVVVGRRLEVAVYRGRVAGSGPSEMAGQTRWFTARELSRAAIPTLTRKVARAVGFL